MPRHPDEGRRAPNNDLDGLLFDIISNIAAILISTGYGFSRVNELTKMAFVRAAYSVDIDSGRKLSTARIAALTGLTRTDVSQISRLREGKTPKLGKPKNRVARVAIGWVADKKFVQQNLKPRPLAFTGPGNTFSELVRKYSGDIPPKAMLSEMTRLGMVTKDQRGLLTLVRSDVTQSRRTTKALKAVIPWIAFLARASTMHVDNELTSQSDKVELKFSSLPQVLAALRELHGRHRAFVSAIEQLGGRMNSSGRYSLDVSVAIAATNPRVSRPRTRASPAKHGVRAIK